MPFQRQLQISKPVLTKQNVTEVVIYLFNLIL